VTLAPEPADVVAHLLEAAARAIAVVAGPGSVSIGPDDAALRIVGIGWATVELDRAAAELGTSLDLPLDAWTPVERDQLLGAAALFGPLLGPDANGPRLVLLEADTEGRLAASLARHGEGVAAVYLVETRAATVAPRSDGELRAGPARSSAAPGPLGRGRLVLGGPISGPHVIVLDALTNPESLPSAGD
jgi:hypothetical protein